MTEGTTAHAHRAKRAVVLIVVAVLSGGGLALGLYAIRRPPRILVVAVKVEDVQRMLAVTGRVEAEQTVIVSPRFAARLTEIVRHEGDRVTMGEVLARLDDATARSTVVQQQSTLSSRADELAQGRRDLAQVTKLAASGAVPATELDAARLAVSRATHDVTRLTAALSDSSTQLELVAPFDGMIMRRAGEVGQVVDPSTTVFEIATVDAARVTAEVDERYVGALQVGLHAEFLPVAVGQAACAGSVSYIARSVDPQTGAATVRFRYLVPPRGVLVGMSVDVDVFVGTVAGAITVPREAVGGTGTRAYVLVLVGDHVERRAVELEDWPAETAIVRGGLAAGEWVAVDPAAAAIGARVHPTQQSDGL